MRIYGKIRTIGYELKRRIKMELIHQGLFLMAAGMGSVFTFLIVMLIAMNICSKVLAYINKYFPEQKEETKKKLQKNNNEAEIAIAVACAAKRMKES